MAGSFAFNQERSSAHVFGPRLGNYIKKRFWSLTFSRQRWYVSSGVVVQKFNVLITESSTSPVSFLSRFCSGCFFFFFASFVFVADGPYRITWCQCRHELLAFNEVKRLTPRKRTGQASFSFNFLKKPLDIYDTELYRLGGDFNHRKVWTTVSDISDIRKAFYRLPAETLYSSLWLLDPW